MSGQWLNPRALAERIVVNGTLLLDTPTHLGSGDVNGPLDMPLILDPLEGKALLPGTSLAGALRSYLAKIEARFADQLFGRVEDEESAGSWLIVDDALGCHPDVELRDGVAIASKSRTAEAKKKFDIELLQAGTEFPLSFELLVPKSRPELSRALALALRGLERGVIRLGARKRRGYGRCRVTTWKMCRYDLTSPRGMFAWLDGDRSMEVRGGDICALLGVTPQSDDPRPRCMLDGIFLLEGSLLIRSGFGEPEAPDFVHLHSNRPKKRSPVPVLSGTSLAGALRARALRIVSTLGKDHQYIGDLFGCGPKDVGVKQPSKSSRLGTEETEIQHPLERVQTRVKIDRFTGGSYPGALINEQPLVSQSATRVHISFNVSDAEDNDVGLVLLLLKDLWTGDLPLGGEIGLGRGRLTGEQAELLYNGDRWIFSCEGNGKLVVKGDKARLEGFVQAFVNGSTLWRC